MNLSRVLHAAEFAARAHHGQLRKYTGEPYVVHPLAVAQTLAQLALPEDAVVAAVLHDVLEDCPKVKPSEIRLLFGEPVLKLVWEVTKPSRSEDGNRAARIEIDAQHYATASPEGQSIKVADLIDNTRTIVQHDASFAKIYMVEKRSLLPRLTSAHPALLAEAKRQIDEYFLLEEHRGHSI